MKTQIELQQFENIYFIGIGGIGMSALARYFVKINKKVAGYDRTETELTSLLAKEGVSIHYQDDTHQIPEAFKNPQKTLVIYTPAIKKHSELNFFTENNFVICKRSEVLGAITRDTFCLAVAGTHGKTTTSGILAHILKENNARFSAFLGGISENFNSNFVSTGNDFTVVEADEFDRSFLQLSPNIACITAVDSDHLDIYGDEETFRKGFEDFTKRLKTNGKLIVQENVPFQGIHYGFSNKNTYFIDNISIKNGKYVFDFHYSDPENNISITEKNYTFPKPGRHNLSNALAAVAMAHQAGFNLQKSLEALASFKGMKRRFSYEINNESFSFIDDYAHHPTELKALYDACREMFPNQEISIIFQPHLYSRTRDFAQDFAQALSLFNEIILLDIYPARELPIQGITSEWLLGKISNKNKKLLSKTELLSYLQNEYTGKVLVTAGAGDISDLVGEIKNIFVKK